MDLLLAKYNDNESNLHFIGNSFTPGQSKYHIEWTVKLNNMTNRYKFEITPSTNNFPAARICYIQPDLAVSYDYYYTQFPPSLWLYNDLILGQSVPGTMGVDSYELVESEEEGEFIHMSVWNRPTFSYVGNVSGLNLDITIDADFPIFASDWQLAPVRAHQMGDAYYNADISADNDRVINCISGDMSDASDAVNYTSIQNTIPQDKIYFIKNILKKNGTSVEVKHYRFKVPPDGKLWLLAEEHEPTGQTYNMTLRAKGLGLPPTFLWQVGGSGTSWTLAHVFTTQLSKYYYGEWTNYSNGDWYKVANLNTNIPIFTSEEEGEMYEDGRLGEDAAINSGELGYDGKITTGDALDSSDIPSPVIAGSGAGVNVWLLDKGNLNSIFADLYSDTQSIIDDIKKGTWQWGNNPIDFIVSIYYVPFDVSSFYDTQTERVYLGQYDTQHDYTQCKETKSSGQRMVLVNTTIDNVYGDWRDLDFFKYDLFLPYVGFVPLDPQIYVGHELKIELAFDVMTHNIRYYLFADGTVIDRIDGSVGYAIPITGTDMVNKANQNLSGAMNLVKAGSDVGMGATQMSKGALVAGFSNVTDGVMGAIGGLKDMMQYPKQIIKGDISASMNIFDINYVYLKITEKQSIYPAEIRQIYNNPSYVCCSLSELSGYCELADVQLVSSCTEREYNEIIQLLKEGVIF